MPCLCFNRLAPQVYDVPRIDFFIQTGKKCNAKCKFCVFHGDKDLKFNYKKRIVQFLKNLIGSVILSFILTFDHLLLPILLQKDGDASFIVFLILVILIFIVQPAIVAMIPAKNNQE